MSVGIFNVVDKAHYRSMCQNLIQIGAKYGNVNAADVLVGRKMVRSEGTGWGRSPPRPLLTVPNVTAHTSTASVPTSYYLM